MKKYILECIGTMVLVLFGCGTAVITGDVVATSLAFGLAIVAMAYAIGPVSGCHVNPAVSLSMLITGKISTKDFVGYIISQVIGGIIGAVILCAILKTSNLGIANLGTNGFGINSAVGLTWFGAILVETLLTFVFIYTILGVTNDESKGNVAGLVIGLTLAFVHLIGIKLTGTSVNPARSLGPALIAGGEALSQVWVFVVAPLLGSVLASVAYQIFNDKPKTVRKKEPEHVEEEHKKVVTVKKKPKKT
jgi:aquaporin Z